MSDGFTVGIKQVYVIKVFTTALSIDHHVDVSCYNSKSFEMNLVGRPLL